MKINIIDTVPQNSLQPLTCTRKLLDCPVGGGTLEAAIKQRILVSATACGNTSSDIIITIADQLWPSPELTAELLSQSKNEVIVCSEKKAKPLAWISTDGKVPKNGQKILMDSKSLLIRYPWDLLVVNEELVGALKEDSIYGEIRNGVTVDGRIVVGKGTVLLPGVYIEGNVIIGENCKVGPNCYFRGNTVIGDKCHIGQAVEIKNSILMNNISAGHLSYVGDSIIGANSNLGAGTITANLRHDGANQRSMINGKLVDTGRRKLGTITGDNVHTGIHTSIYPGRKIWPNMYTSPGEIVQKDILTLP